uniref:Uncharacterized protein n=1 Tax=Pond slider nidovirus TaxID=2961778 RepID=A0A9N6YJY9_9NIDO|nr:TPA_asm: hypothetical protein [Pond slider nidovirus]
MKMLFLQLTLALSLSSSAFAWLVYPSCSTWHCALNSYVQPVCLKQEHLSKGKMSTTPHISLSYSDAMTAPRMASFCLWTGDRALVKPGIIPNCRDLGGRCSLRDGILKQRGKPITLKQVSASKGYVYQHPLKINIGGVSAGLIPMYCSCSLSYGNKEQWTRFVADKGLGQSWEKYFKNWYHELTPGVWLEYLSELDHIESSSVVTRRFRKETPLCIEDTNVKALSKFSSTMFGFEGNSPSYVPGASPPKHFYLRSMVTAHTFMSKYNLTNNYYLDVIERIVSVNPWVILSVYDPELLNNGSIVLNFLARRKRNSCVAKCVFPTVHSTRRHLFYIYVCEDGLL